MIDEALAQPSKDVMNLSKLQLLYALVYRSMWAFSNHIRVRAIKLHLRTYDSSMAAMFHQPCCVRLVDINSIFVGIEYVE